MLNLVNLLLQPFILGQSIIVVFLQFVAIDVAGRTQEFSDVVHGSFWSLVLLIELNENFCQLVDCAGLFEIVFEFGFFGIDSLY